MLINLSFDLQEKKIFSVAYQEICLSLTKKMESLSLLKESLTKSEALTHNMLGILTSFENRLSKLEETITPIYKETDNLQRRHESMLYFFLFSLFKL